jgi:hypothetical protein
MRLWHAVHRDLDSFTMENSKPHLKTANNPKGSERIGRAVAVVLDFSTEHYSCHQFHFSQPSL